MAVDPQVEIAAQVVELALRVRWRMYPHAPLLEYVYAPGLQKPMPRSITDPNCIGSVRLYMSPYGHNVARVYFGRHVRTQACATMREARQWLLATWLETAEGQEYVKRFE